MVTKKELTTRRFNLADCTFSVEECYKAIRKVSDKLRYDFIEKEQELKPDKYGHERNFNFFLAKKWDTFAKAELEITMKFKHLNKVKVDGKEIEKGDVEITAGGSVLYDYKNEWRKSRFFVWLFEGIYLKYFVEDEIKKKYLKPTGADLNEIYMVIKDKLNEFA
ncbi:MAG: hypothetical protein WC595_05675 [Candidatus Nanoarchaeia archaeon]